MDPGRHVIAALACVLLALPAVARGGPPATDTSSVSVETGDTVATPGPGSGTDRLQQAPPPPKPRDAGIHELLTKIAGDFATFPSRESTWVILGVGAAGAAAAHPIDHNVNGHLVGSRTLGRFFAPGKWIGSAPVQIGTSVGLYVIGRYVLPHAQGAPKTNKVSHLGFDLLRAQIVSGAFVEAIKVTVRRDRPTGACCAFPSGHAAAAFAVASVLERHLGYRAAWPTLVIASYVGTSRLHDNQHFLSDVVFGSALGLATGWMVVGRHGRSDYSMTPVPVRGGVALMVSRVTRKCEACGRPAVP